MRVDWEVRFSGNESPTTMEKVVDIIYEALPRHQWENRALGEHCILVELQHRH
jgi:hypothetical protein